MRKVLVASLALLSFLGANDYEFSFDELEQIETKPYEYSGYIKGEHKHQVLNESAPNYPSKNKNSMDSYFTEAYLDFKYFEDNYTIETNVSANYENIDNIEDDTYTLQQLYANYKFNDNHQIVLGKKTPKWGKGYFSNPIGFIDKKKDPNDPEASREGYLQLNYKYNKVYQGDLQNLSFDIVYLRTTKDINEELYNDESNIVALKTYMLYRDIDIDIAYYYNDEYKDKLGVDFSTNLEVNFEIHGEYARDINNDEYSYLLGFKYLTDSELTILSEYIYQNKQQVKTTPLWDKRYIINSFTQKEPLDILYFNIYYKNMLNLEDDSYQNKLGFTYSGFKNIDIDFSFTKNRGSNSSEFGSKLVDRFSWLNIKYSF